MTARKFSGGAVRDKMIIHMRRASRFLTLFLAVGGFVLYFPAQAKKTMRPVKPVSATEAVPTPTPAASKKNERPVDTTKPSSAADTNYKPTYFYEFTRPGFLTWHIVIEHDMNGRGKISFQQQDFPEMMADPIQLSPATLKGIDETLERMDFLGSTENYQYEKDMPQMGDIVFRFTKAGRERTVKFNWTTNKDARFLMDEYRRISNEATWKFALAVSRENQPLQTPSLMDAFDSYFRLDEISDPPHLIPLLMELSNDERLPLIARNHATRLIRQIEKIKK